MHPRADAHLLSYTGVRASERASGRGGRTTGQPAVRQVRRGEVVEASTARYDVTFVPFITDGRWRDCAHLTRLDT